MSWLPLERRTDYVPMHSGEWFGQQRLGLGGRGGGGKDEDVIAHRGMQEAGECVVHARVTSGSESAGSAEGSFSPDRY